ncbi:hypothetical protein Trydic_g18796 [Trypoxylus dichotomus]
MKKSAKCPNMYRLSQINKQDVRLRPIVSTIGLPTQALARYLANQLKLYGEQMISYVNNAGNFIDIPHQKHVKSADMLASFDVSSLFTQVPIDEAAEIIRNKN